MRTSSLDMPSSHCSFRFCHLPKTLLGRWDVNLSVFDPTDLSGVLLPLWTSSGKCPGTPSLFESYRCPTLLLALLLLHHLHNPFPVLESGVRKKSITLTLDILPNDLIWAISIPFCSLKCLQLWHSKARWDLPPTPSSHFLLSCHKLKGTARILEWAALPFSRWSSQPRDQTQASRIVGGFFTSWASRAAQEYCSG